MRASRSGSPPTRNTVPSPRSVTRDARPCLTDIAGRSTVIPQNAVVRPVPPVLPPAHGYRDDRATRRLLRSRPPTPALAWVESALGGRITSVRPIRGGMSSAVHALGVELGSGATARVVLRRHVRAEVVDEEPEIAGREAAILAFLGRVELPTPLLLAVDPGGDQADVPSLLMSMLPGRVDWSPAGMDSWLRRLAEPLPILHAMPLPPRGTLPAFFGYAQRSYEPPSWARWPEAWGRAVEIFHAPSRAEATACIHRDYHPGNVLWQAGRVTGIVDWPSASIGSPSIDVAHCRANLLGRFDIGVADRFTQRWEELTGRRFNPWADVMIIIGMLDGLRDDPHLNRASVEEALARSVADL